MFYALFRIMNAISLINNLLLIQIILYRSFIYNIILATIIKNNTKCPM